MRIPMRYGRKGLNIDLPDDTEVDIIKKRVMPVIEDPGLAIETALSTPVASLPLEDEAGKCKDACMLICDNTRPVPNSIILPVLIEKLIEAGLGPSSITVLVATGLHRPNEGDELRELVGSDWVLKNVNVVNHFALNDDDHIYLGTTSKGMPVKIDRRFVNAGLRIVIGLIEPHFMAGYSGGRKVIIPGIAHHDTIRALHSARMLMIDGVENCEIQKNPMHAEQMEAIKMIGRCLAINTVIDEHRNISFINFGGIEESHIDAVLYAKPFFEIPVSRRYRTVITSSAGYPLDRNYYQTVKGMVGAIDILEPGGDMFIVSECTEGLGTKDYAESQKRLINLGIDRFLKETLKKDSASIDEWETVMQIKAMKKGRLHIYSEGLKEEEKMLTGIEVVSSLEGSILKSIKESGDRHIAVIPEGPYVIPVYRQDKKII